MPDSPTRVATRRQIRFGRRYGLPIHAATTREDATAMIREHIAVHPRTPEDLARSTAARAAERAACLDARRSAPPPARSALLAERLTGGRVRLRSAAHANAFFASLRQGARSHAAPRPPLS